MSIPLAMDGSSFSFTKQCHEALLAREGYLEELQELAWNHESDGGSDGLARGLRKSFEKSWTR